MACWRRLAGSAGGRGQAGGASSGAAMETGERPAGPAGPSTDAAAAASYFRRVRPLAGALVAAGLAFYGWAVFSPATVPYDYLGPLGTITRYLVENHRACLNAGYVLAWLIHICEMFYALKLCRDKGITDGPTQFRWAVQTFLFGMFSLSLLLNYDPAEKRKNTSEGFDRKKN